MCNGLKYRLNLVQKVRVNSELVYNFDDKLHNDLGIINKIDYWVFPYEVKFDNDSLNELLKSSPRRFVEYELNKV